MKSAQYRTDTCHQLFGVKRLDDVIIRSKFQSQDFVKGFSLGGKHNDRYIGGVTDLTAYLVSVNARKHDIQKDQVRKLFCIEASPYWRTHHVPGAESDESPKRIGAFKANIIGINLVAVLQFAYGSYTGSERLRDSALTLLERLPAEDNRYMRAWQAAGVRPRNAFESQALLQLATEYCAARRCAECPVGRRIAKSLAED